MNSSSGDTIDWCDSNVVVVVSVGVNVVVSADGEVLVDDDADGCIDVVLDIGDVDVNDKAGCCNNVGDVGAFDKDEVKERDDCNNVESVVDPFEKIVFDIGVVLVKGNTVLVGCDVLVVLVFIDNDGGIEVKHVGDSNNFDLFKIGVDGCGGLNDFVFVFVGALADRFEDNNVGFSKFGNAGGAWTKWLSVAKKEIMKMFMKPYSIIIQNTMLTQFLIF